MKTRSILPLFLLFLAACGGGEAAPKPTQQSNAAIPQSLRLDAAPPAAQSVLEVRKTANDGADVVLTGRVKDFVANRAMFTLADMSLKSCADPEDKMGCETPWDYCCEEPNKIAEGTASIEMHDAGKLIESSVQGWNGIDHLKQVVVKGKLKKDDKGNLAVIATGIYVQS